MSLIELIDLPCFADERGSLVAIEPPTSLPFEIKRVYYLHNLNPAMARGFHSHKNLQQLMICVSGSCQITLDDGNNRETVEMTKPNQGLWVKARTWREMHNFSMNCVLLVLASDYYDPADYILSYEKFLEQINE